MTKMFFTPQTNFRRPFWHRGHRFWKIAKTAHDPPESMPTIAQNHRPRSFRMTAHDGPEYAITGNTVVDALHLSIPKARKYKDPVLDEIDQDPRRVILASAHRRESWPMLPDIAEALAEVANTQDVRVVIPLHKNPVVREALSARLKDHPNITLLEPLPYLGFVRLMLRANI